MRMNDASRLRQGWIRFEDLGGSRPRIRLNVR